MLYCPHCNRNVDVSRWTGTRIAILIILLILGVILGLVYLVYVMTQAEVCPVCGTPASMMTMIKNEADIRSDSTAPSDGPSVSEIYCPNCGAHMSSSAKFCNNCGAALGKH